MALADRVLTGPEVATCLLSIIGELTRQVAWYEDGMTWETNCLNCASLLDRNYEMYVEREIAIDRAGRDAALSHIGRHR